MFIIAEDNLKCRRLLYLFHLENQLKLLACLVCKKYLCHRIMCTRQKKYLNSHYFQNCSGTLKKGAQNVRISVLKLDAKKHLKLVHCKSFKCATRIERHAHSIIGNRDFNKLTGCTSKNMPKILLKMLICSQQPRHQRSSLPCRTYFIKPYRVKRLSDKIFLPGIRTPPTPHASVRPTLWFRGEGHTRWREERGWQSPNSNEGTSCPLWSVLFICMFKPYTVIRCKFNQPLHSHDVSLMR